MKLGPFDDAGFEQRLRSERDRIALQNDAALIDGVHDHSRQRRYRAASWSFGVIDLAACAIWPGMGERPWPCLTVPAAAERLSRLPRGDRLHSMLLTLHRTIEQIPLVVFTRGRNAAQFRIDDGCHRAVSYCRAGVQRAPAFVGRYDGPGRLQWIPAGW